MVYAPTAWQGLRFRVDYYNFAEGICERAIRKFLPNVGKELRRAKAGSCRKSMPKASRKPQPTAKIFAREQVPEAKIG